jgi:hypothetical protein
MCREVAMEVDVVTEVEIGRPRAEVAAYAMNPDNAMIWYRNITKVDWKTPPPLQVGSRVAFVAKFLGRTIAYTYRIEELVPNELLVMATTEGPFAMATTYSWSDIGDGGTRMTLRNSGRPSGFSKIAAPMMAKAIRRANTKDLACLKDILTKGRDQPR